MKPTDVKHERFPVDKVLYDDGLFSVVWGSWDGGKKSLGMRWNEATGPKGFPTSGPHLKPVWLVIPQELSLPFLSSILGKKAAHNTEILEAIGELEARGDLAACRQF